MANFEIPESPEYIKEIRKFEPEDPAHAKLFNKVTQALVNNDEFLREAIGIKQSKLGIGTFTKNIDILGDDGLPQTSSICWCQSNVVEGTLPYESDNAYWFVLETNVVLDNSTIRSQKATVWEQNGNRVFERIFTNGEWYAWKEYLKTDGDSKDTKVSFTSEDDLNPTEWTDASELTSEEKQSSIFNKVSIMLKNIRWIYKTLGTADLSGIGTGTVTNAVKTMNDLIGAKKSFDGKTDIQYSYPKGTVGTVVSRASSLNSALKDATQKITDEVCSLNAGLMDVMGMKTWKTSTVSFVGCTGTNNKAGIEGFLDLIVSPKVMESPTADNNFKVISGGTGGNVYCSLTIVYSKEYYGGIVFTYGTSTAQFFYVNGGYAIRFL